MRTGTIVLVGALAAAWLASFSAAQTPEDDARALAARRREAAEIEAKRKADAAPKARAALAAKERTNPKTELERFLPKSVPQARAVGVGILLAAKTYPPLVGRVGVAEKTVVVPTIQDLEVRWGAMLYGPRPKGEKVSLSIELPRDRLVEQFRKGDKIIFAWGKAPRHGIAAVRWSKQAEKAVLLALAPGWQRGKCFRCPWCREKRWVKGKGKCSLCGGATGSRAFKLCAKCAAVAGRCQMCKRTVGPATRGVRLRLTPRDPRAKTMAEARFEHGERIRLWVSASVAGKTAVAELPCPGGKELNGCETLCFIVDSPGRREAAVLFPILPLRTAKAKLKPKPLTSAGGAVQAFWARFDLNDGKGVFKREGRHTVRAVAGRLVSNPITVVVKEPKPAAPVPRPQPRPRPAWIDKVVPQITPDSRGVQATRDGKMMWKMKCSFVIGAIEQKDGLLTVTSADGRTVIKLDLATGQMISKRVTR